LEIGVELIEQLKRLSAIDSTKELDELSIIKEIQEGFGSNRHLTSIFWKIG